ncbi:MAG: glycosyltransferase [Acidiferrobacteraceae bacterium]
MISEHASPMASLGGADCGGQNVYVGQVARHLAKQGYEVDVFSRRDRADLPAIQPWAPGTRIINVPAGPPCQIPKEELLPYMDDFSAFFNEFCAGRKRRYALVHANFWMSGLVAVRAKMALGIPFVVTFHALGRVRQAYHGIHDGFPAERIAIEQLVIREAESVIAECPQDRHDLVSLYGAPPEKIVMIPCGFDPENLWPVREKAARSALGLPEDSPLLLQLGRMVPRKGVDNVIRAVAILKERAVVDAHLVVVGGESERIDSDRSAELTRLRGLSRDLGVSDRIFFVGRRGADALRYYYSAADLFISTPWYEPFGITPVEAMACGTPVIGSAVGGIKYTVLDGRTGYLVPARDPEALADRISYCYRNPALFPLLGAQAVRRANQYFTWQQVARAISGLYQTVLESRVARIKAIQLRGVTRREGNPGNNSLATDGECAIERRVSRVAH